MASAPPKRVGRPYKDFLTPFLHRNFVQAALVTLAACYLEAAWFAGLADFWSWFPIGLQGVRTLLLFISALAVFILRVAGMHVGRRYTTSRAFIVNTFLWYTFSAWFFGEVYVWCQPADLRLATVDQGRSHERPKLNERLVFLRYMFIFSGIAQAIYHIHNDNDRLAIPVPRSMARAGSSAATPATPVTLPLSIVKQQLMAAFNGTVQRTITVGGAGLILYLVVGRFYAWQLSLALARPIFNLPKNHRPTAFPTFIGDLIGRFAVESFLLNALWQIVNTTFTVYVSQLPTKNSVPLTTGSKDPNGSLIAGLKAKKIITRTFAFWELALISSSFSDRRVSIYRDIDRTDGSAWSQIYTVSLAELHALVKRIQDFQNPPAKFQSLDQGPVNQLPKISDAVVGNSDKIFASSAQHVGAADTFGRFARSHGQSPDRALTLPQAQHFVSEKASALLSKSALSAPATSPTESLSGIAGYVRGLSLRILQSRLGDIFRITYDRRASAIMFDSATSNINTVTSAIIAISNFALNSLAQDTYGRVASDIPNILRTYVSTISTIESFRDGLEAHWTDVHFVEGRQGTRNNCEEINHLLNALRDGLTEMITRFEPYHETLSLSIGDIRKSKQAARMDRPET